MSGLSLSPKNLETALLFVEKVTGRTCAESLNRAGLHTIIGSKGYPGAMKLTPKATRAAIQSVSPRMLRGAVIARAKRKGEWPLKAAELAQRVRRERGRRIQAIGYAAFAGWNNASKAMGGRGLKTNSGFAESEASRGKGVKASVGSLLAIITNTAPAAERIGVAALQTGLDNAARDLVDYGNRKLQEDFDKVKL